MLRNDIRVEKIKIWGLGFLSTKLHLSRALAGGGCIGIETSVSTPLKAQVCLQTDARILTVTTRTVYMPRRLAGEITDAPWLNDGYSGFSYNLMPAL